MNQRACDGVETPVQLEAPDKENEPEVPLSALTAVIESVGCGERFGGTYLPSVKIKVRLSFANGEEIVSSVETPAVSAGVAEQAPPPYAFAEATVPDQPVLVSSSNFVQVG